MGDVKTMTYTPKILSTAKIDPSKGCKSVVYGPSGVGKTRLAITAEKPFIISSENGLISLRKENIPYVEVRSAKDVRDIHKWVTESTEARQFWTVIVDSGTDLAEVTLSDCKKRNADGRAAYGEMQDTINDMFRDFRDMVGKHVVIIAKELIKSDGNPIRPVMKAEPVMPTDKMQAGLPYFFDLVLHLHNMKWEGQDYKCFHTTDAPTWFAKDRSGALNPIELANIGQVFRKAMSN